MKWNVKDHPENLSKIRWDQAFIDVVPRQLSAAFIRHGHVFGKLHPFASETDGGAAAISRRWLLEIKDIPETVHWPGRSVIATVVAQDDHNYDGATFGQISVWEHSPSRKDSIFLEVDLTKVRSQGHQFGLHVLVAHGTKPTEATPEGISDRDPGAPLEE